MVLKGSLKRSKRRFRRINNLFTSLGEDTAHEKNLRRVKKSYNLSSPETHHKKSSKHRNGIKPLNSDPSPVYVIEAPFLLGRED